MAASVAEARLQGVAEEKIQGCRKLAESDRLAFLGWSGVSVRAFIRKTGLSPRLSEHKL